MNFWSTCVIPKLRYLKQNILPISKPQAMLKRILSMWMYNHLSTKYISNFLSQFIHTLYRKTTNFSLRFIWLISLFDGKLILAKLNLGHLLQSENMVKGDSTKLNSRQTIKIWKKRTLIFANIYRFTVSKLKSTTADYWTTQAQEICL